MISYLCMPHYAKIYLIHEKTRVRLRLGLGLCRSTLAIIFLR